MVQNADRVRFGRIAFYIVVDVAKPAGSEDHADPVTTTIRPQNLAPVVLPPVAGAPARARPTSPPDEENTNVGLPGDVVQACTSRTGGGGGLIEADGKQVQLTTTQFELMALMIKRMASEAHQPRAGARLREVVRADRRPIVGHARAEREPRQAAGTARTTRTDEVGSRRSDRIAT